MSEIDTSELTGPNEESEESGAESEESEEEATEDEPDDDELLTPEMSLASPEPSHGVAAMHTPITHGEHKAMQAEAAAIAASITSAQPAAKRVVKPARPR